MRSLLLIFLPVFLLFTSFSDGKVKKVGVYDQDSVLMSMTDYKNVLDSIERTKAQLPFMVKNAESELERKQKEFDSLHIHWSPLIKSLKQKEINDLREQVLYLKGGTTLISDLKEELTSPFLLRIQIITDQLLMNGSYDAVLNKQSLESYRQSFKYTGQPINITQEMIGFVNKPTTHSSPATNTGQ
jgi:hypothetical protein